RIGFHSNPSRVSAKTKPEPSPIRKYTRASSQQLLNVHDLQRRRVRQRGVRGKSALELSGEVSKLLFRTRNFRPQTFDRLLLSLVSRLRQRLDQRLLTAAPECGKVLTLAHQCGERVVGGSEARAHLLDRCGGSRVCGPLGDLERFAARGGARLDALLRGRH